MDKVPNARISIHVSKSKAKSKDVVYKLSMPDKTKANYENNKCLVKLKR